MAFLDLPMRCHHTRAPFLLDPILRDPFHQTVRFQLLGMVLLISKLLNSLHMLNLAVHLITICLPQCASHRRIRFIKVHHSQILVHQTASQATLRQHIPSRSLRILFLLTSCLNSVRLLPLFHLFKTPLVLIQPIIIERAHRHLPRS